MITTLEVVDGFERRRVASNGENFHRQGQNINETRSAGDIRWALFRVESGTSGRASCQWRNATATANTLIVLNTSTGAVTSRQESAGAIFHEEITDLGNGVWEVLFGFTVAAASTINFLSISPQSSIAGEDVIVHGAQLTDARSDCITESADTASYTHWFSRVGDRGLWVEPEATNMTLHSGDLDQSPWDLEYYAPSPSTLAVAGGEAGFTWWRVNSTGYTYANLHQTPFALTAGQTYTVSAYARRGDAAEAVLRVRLHDSNTGVAILRYDWSSGSIVDGVSGGSIKIIGTDKIRMTMSFVPTVTRGHRVQCYAGWNAANVYTDWSAVQLEAGSVATSYILTYGSTVTRTADSVEIGDNEPGESVTLTYEDGSTGNLVADGAGDLTLTASGLAYTKIENLVG
jgi:hypothetical protein